MKWSRIIAVLVVLAGSFTISAGLALTGSPSDPVSSESSWQTRVLSCSSEQDSAGYDETCLQALWESAFREKGLKDLNEALYQQQQRDPRLSVFCHDLGHRAGRDAFAEAKDAAALIQQAASDRFACNNGFVHGVLDGMAKSSPSETSVQAAFQECQKLEGEARANCVDGSGHASWQLTHDLPEAYRLCQAFPETSDATACAAGVIMQMYRPDTDGSAPAALEREAAPEDLARLCPPLLDAFPQNMALACFGTAGQPFSFEADAATRRVFSESPEKLPADKGQELKGMWKDALNKCQVFSDYAEGTRVCEEFVAGAIVWTAPSQDYLQQLCSQLPARVVSACLSAKMS